MDRGADNRRRRVHARPDGRARGRRRRRGRARRPAGEGPRPRRRRHVPAVRRRDAVRPLRRRHQPQPGRGGDGGGRRGRDRGDEPAARPARPEARTMSELDLIVRGGTVVAPDGVRGADVGIAGGRIAAVAPELDGGAREDLDAAGLHVLPGAVDAHVHFNDPGRADYEGFETGTRAAAAGGTTTGADMPLNAQPPTIDAAAFDRKRAAVERTALVDFALWGGLVPGNADRLEELAARGVVGF